MIDIIIPAFKAHKTIWRAVASIACQTAIKDIKVTIVNDCCPDGDYGQVVQAFEPCMDIREIKLPKNSGPGVARQTGIDSTDGEFIAFLDADDSFMTVKALETLRDAIQEDNAYQCASGAFYNDKFVAAGADRICRMMVWVFSKLYRRAFLDKYRIRFSNTRANEDSGFNHIIGMLCDGKEEKIKFVEEYLYLYHDDNPNSITRINNAQYFYDQCNCGGIDNMIYAIEHVRKYAPFSEQAIKATVDMILQSYWYYAEVDQFMPSLTIPLWEHIKKFYHRCYKLIEGLVTDEAFRCYFSNATRAAMRSGTFVGVVPKMTLGDFMERLRTESYDPDLINEIREEMKNDPDYHDMQLYNIACGVMPEDENAV